MLTEQPTSFITQRCRRRYAGLDSICDAFDVAFFQIIELGVLAQYKKFERAYMSDEVAVRISPTEWGPRSPGYPVLLGKQFKLSTATKSDTAERLAEVEVLLLAILHQAATNKQDVFESSLRRALGLLVFCTDSCVFLRMHLKAMIKGLKAAGSWSKCKAVSSSTDYSWRMAQACHFGAKIAAQHDTAAFNVWLDQWQLLDLGRKCKLPLSAKSQLEAIIYALPRHNTQCFMPRRSSVALHNMIFLCVDSAGLSDEDPTAPRACGGWAACSAWKEIKWFQEARLIHLTVPRVRVQSTSGAPASRF